MNTCLNIFEYNNYKDFLKEELVNRNKSNPLYTLRAFARDLSVSPSRLSEVLSHHYHFSMRSGLKVSRSLGFLQKEEQYFLELIKYQTEKSEIKRKISWEFINKYFLENSHENIKLDTFRYLNKWYVLAIWNIFFVKDIRGAKDIKLLFPNVSMREIKKTLFVLTLFDMIKEDSSGVLKPTKNKISFFYEMSSKEIQEYHRQYIELAKRSISEQSISERFLYNLVIPFSQADVHLINNEIKEFVKTLSCKLNERRVSTKDDCIYAVNIQGFRVASCKGGQEQNYGN